MTCLYIERKRRIVYSFLPDPINAGRIAESARQPSATGCARPQPSVGLGYLVGKKASLLRQTFTFPSILPVKVNGNSGIYGRAEVGADVPSPSASANLLGTVRGSLPELYSFGWFAMRPGFTSSHNDHLTESAR